ncbi:MAG: hypothetical protein WCS31_17320 [Verrucomicrobiae bacterium]
MNPLPLRALLLPALAAAFLGAGCDRPAEPAAPPQEAGTQEPGAQETGTPASVVTIPEEFQTPPQPPIPATPRILFAARNFQVKTESGIQGIKAGETVDVLREDGENAVVRYGGLEFTRPLSFFSATFVSSPPSQAGPAAPDPEPAGTLGLATPATEPALPGETLPAIPLHLPRQSAGDRKLAELTDSIRVLNERIRAAQSGPSGKQPTRAEMRALEQMKADRDALSLQLTTLGKP